MTSRHELFTKRGISAQVADARGYIRYSAKDPVIARDLFGRIPARQRGATVSRRVNYSAGWLMPRFAVPIAGMRLTKVLPEFGPADTVEPRIELHDHTDPPVWVPHIHARSYADAHRGQNVVGEHQHETFDEPHRHDPVDREVWREHVAGKRHDGDAPEGEHEHVKAPKYLFAPSPYEVRPWKGNHTDTPSHLKRRHGGGDGASHAREPDHGHWDIVKVKEGYARRLDMNPLTIPALKSREYSRAFFVIEGVLKNDSLVTAGEIAFNVPSVGQWDAPELEAFADAWLQDVPVFIIPDSDWITNPAVSLQAFTCREALSRYGVKAYVAANPPKIRRTDTKGIDDWLGAGGTVDGLMVAERTTSLAMHLWMSDYIGTRTPGTRIDARETDAWVLEAAALLSDGHGRVTASASAIARFLGWSNPQRVRAAFARLVELTDGDKEMNPFEQVNGDPFKMVRRKRGPRIRDEYADPPTFTIRTDLRADTTSTTLGQFVPKGTPRIEPLPEAPTGPFAVQVGLPF